MPFVRFLLGLLVALGVLLLALPAVVLADLVSGGTGLGMCPNGLGTCETSVFTIAELVFILGMAAIVVGGGIAWCVRWLRRSAQRSVSL
ncbi:MAG: hypothetical protein QNJ71_00100 [Acidimicrobiia bacterium]|nr:hypothetical protein [Acidimicrobiia bacterium]